jgi:hypothetical protein
MYILPIYIKKYKAKIKADCLVKNIRFNTMSKYDEDGYIKQSNPRGLICRNEKDKTIILRDRPYYQRHMGGVTALMIADGDSKDELVITSIEYHDWGGTISFVFLFALAIYGLIDGANPLFVIFIIVILFFLNSLDRTDLKRQREFVQRMINDCENK